MAELSVRYASALFDLASEDNDRLLDEFYEQAASVRDALRTEDCLGVIESPSVPKSEKYKFIEEVFAENIHEHLYGFLYLQISKGHEKCILASLSAFIEAVDIYHGKTTAYVVSATELSGGQIEALREMLSKKLNKQVEVEARVDPQLIGGFYIHIDGYLIDYTIKKQLNDLRESIKIVL
jgi:F-type H+-transporting ATPase subunit delta